jgi:hypothetical protein
MEERPNTEADQEPKPIFRDAAGAVIEHATDELEGIFDGSMPFGD